MPSSDADSISPLASAREAKRFFEVSLDLLCVADPQGYFLKVNPQFERILGYSAEELTSRPILDFVHPDDREDTQEALETLQDDENVDWFTNRYVCKNDSVVWLEWRSRAYQDGDLIYASARDVTELKRSEREREQLEAQFQQAQKLESVGVLAGGIAHDFNNLLTTILGNAGLIRMQMPDDHPVHERADAIENASQTAADLCEQLLAYAGAGQFDVGSIDLSEVVQETDHLLEASVSKSVDVHYDLADDLPSAELDATQMQQILMNVVKNGAEAIGEDEVGTIEIVTGRRWCARSDLTDTYLDDDLQPGEYVFLKVTDTGCGMSEREMQRIFDPFYTTKFAGRGLGLAATLGIVRAHNGALNVDSTPGEGTTFEFLFPATETNTPFSPSDGLSAVPVLDSETVLVVDDERDILDFVTHTLGDHDVEVLCAESGRDAIRLYREHGDRISTVYLDLTMPKIDGEETFIALRDLDPDVPVILWSGYSESMANQAFREQSFQAFLQKPFGPEDLLRTLSEALAT